MARQRSSRSADPQHGDPVAPRAAAIALLARRDLSSTELRQKLRAKKFDETTTAVVMAELTQEGILDDARFAQNYVAYHARRGQGPLRIAAELRRLGLAASLVDAALAAGPDWRSVALKVRRAKFGLQPPQNWPQKARQARFLQYRGFSSDHIRAATGADLEFGPNDLE